MGWRVHTYPPRVDIRNSRPLLYLIYLYSPPAPDVKGYVTPVPDIYSDLPQLKGRATVEMTIKRPGGEKFNIEGRLFDEAKMKMIIDGYTGKCSPFATPRDIFDSGSFWSADHIVVGHPPPPPSRVTKVFPHSSFPFCVCPLRDVNYDAHAEKIKRP